jgi:hypothetical protein
LFARGLETFKKTVVRCVSARVGVGQTINTDALKFVLVGLFLCGGGGCGGGGCSGGGIRPRPQRKEPPQRGRARAGGTAVHRCKATKDDGHSQAVSEPAHFERKGEKTLDPQKSFQINDQTRQNNEFRFSGDPFVKPEKNIRLEGGGGGGGGSCCRLIATIPHTRFRAGAER